MSNLLEYENRYYDLGYDYIIGLDEAGRGPMAGELVVAGVIFPKGFYDERIFDSKQLTAKKREAMYQIIIENALAYHIEVISVEDVDQLNVYSASQKGMEKCCQAAPSWSAPPVRPLSSWRRTATWLRFVSRPAKSASSA